MGNLRPRPTNSAAAAAAFLNVHASVKRDRSCQASGRASERMPTPDPKRVEFEGRRRRREVIQIAKIGHEIR